VFGLSVVPERRRRGHMRHIYALLAHRLDGDLYGQIEEGLATLTYRSTRAGTERLARTFTFRRADDPLLNAP
jgi:hypothetical protein